MTQSQNWGGYFFFGMLPFLVRFVQSLRRYRDSKLPGQLVNVRKLHDLYSFRAHHQVPIGWEVRDGNHTNILLLLLEATRYVRLCGDDP